jgi:hypothetical protein
MRDSIESMTVKLEPESDGVIINSDLIGIRPVLRQQSEFALKFGVPMSGKEVSPILGVAYPATVTMVPMSDNVLSLKITYLDGSGTQTLRFEVSSDGNTLTEVLPPPDNLRVVFDRQFRSSRSVIVVNLYSSAKGMPPLEECEHRLRSGWAIYSWLSRPDSDSYNLAGLRFRSRSNNINFPSLRGTGRAAVGR